jgi:hypothetical protein
MEGDRLRGRPGDPGDWAELRFAAVGPIRELPAAMSAAPAAPSRELPRCLRCGFAVISLPWGCKNPCRNCGFVYPLGDCSD